MAAVEREAVAALGPGARIGALRADWNHVEIDDLRIPGPPDWPAEDALRARSVRITPSWRSLLSRRIAIARIEASGTYLSVLRSRDGRIHVLPSLGGGSPAAGPAAQAPRAAVPPAAAPPERTVTIGELHVDDGALELFDATVATPPWKIRLQEIDGSLRDVVTPLRAGHMPLELSAAFIGPQRTGRIGFSGWLDANTRDLDLRGTVRGADLLALQPYFVEQTKGRLASGALDLDLHAVVTSRRLHAPGHLVLSQLAFASGGSPTARVFGVPRDLLLAGLAAKGGRIELDFALEGDIDDPRFRLDEAFSTRVAVEMAKALGVSVGGLVEGVGGLGLDALEGSGKAAGGLGSALKKLIPKRK